MALRDAKTVLLRIEALVTARTTGGIDPETARWLNGLDDVMHERIAKTGLAPSRERARVTLARLLDAFFETIEVKPQTAVVYGQTRKSLEEYFGADRLLDDIGTLDADRWRQWMRSKQLADATIAKRVKTARQVFRQGVRWKMLTENPFADVKSGCQTNRARMFFITQADAEAVLAACPDAQWRLIFGLSRYGGMRCPSEHLLLRWQDIDWAGGRMLVTSPKTEGNPGGGSRQVPIFPELRPLLMEVFEQADEGSEYVITRYRQRNCNLRTQLLRILARAGLKPWPKLFHNLRSSRQTELEERFPTHVVCSWLGNSPAVARAHYLQVRDTDFQKAIAAEPKVATADLSGASGAAEVVGAGGVLATAATPANERCDAESGAQVAQNPTQHAAARSRNQSQIASQAFADCGVTRDAAKPCDSLREREVTPRGFEPLSPG